MKELEVGLANIDLSSQIIVFDQQSHTGELTITNKHNSLAVVFKIKATKLKAIQVKPAKGHIKPLGKTVISFKLANQMSHQQMQAMERHDKFLIQVLNTTTQQANRQQVQNMWASYKKGTANLEHGYGCFKVEMNLTGQKRMASSKFSAGSNMNAETVTSKMYQTTNVKQSFGEQFKAGSKLSSVQRDVVSDAQLSNKYQVLREKQRFLQQKREGIFRSSSTPKSQKSSKGGNKFVTILVLLIVFSLAFLGGNYWRSGMVKVKGN